MQETELTLDRIGFPPFSARNCHQTLVLVTNGDLKRTINGKLVYLGTTEQSHKYKSTIQCQDKSAPALEGIGRGTLIKVGCIQRFSQSIDDHQNIFLKRDPVEYSVFVMDAQKNAYEILKVENRKVFLQDNQIFNDQLYVSYRPLLSMCVTNYKLFTDEWAFINRWELELEEI